MADVQLYKRGTGNDVIAGVDGTADSTTLLSLGLGVDASAQGGTLLLADASGSSAYIQATDGDSAAVAPAGEGRLRYDGATETWQVSENTGAYHPLVPLATAATATADTTTTSASDVLVNSMTLTPAAGTYMVWFSGSVDHSANNGSGEMSIYAGGAQVASSERDFARGAGQGDVTTPFTCVALVTVDGIETIEGQWRTASATLTMHERTLHIVEVRT